jgi:transcriptional regulator
VYDSSRYPTDPDAADAWAATAHHGTLIATSPGGHPQVSLLPFVRDEHGIEIHCVQEDPTWPALVANPLVTFLVSDFLAFSPHDWLSEVDAGMATLHFRAVAYECRAHPSTDPAEVAGALERLTAAYSPDSSWDKVQPGGRYDGRLERLATARLEIVRIHAKDKVGPAGPPARKRAVAAGLRGRGLPGDARAAAEIEAAARQAEG